jgi:RNA polymerase sigma-70 factor (ECF subfamily)
LNPSELLTSAQRGDRRALEALLRANRPAVYRYGLRYCPTLEDAEDAVQETLWAAAKSISRFRRASTITTWLFSIVRNHCFHLHRRGAARPERALAEEMLATLLDDSPGAADPARQARLRRVLARALARLDPWQREVIIARDVEGLTAPEAARAAGLGVQALKSRLHRAREELRRLLLEELATCEAHVPPPAGEPIFARWPISALAGNARSACG